MDAAKRDAKANGWLDRFDGTQPDPAVFRKFGFLTIKRVAQVRAAGRNGPATAKRLPL